MPNISFNSLGISSQASSPNNPTSLCNNIDKPRLFLGYKITTIAQIFNFINPLFTLIKKITSYSYEIFFGNNKDISTTVDNREVTPSYDFKFEYVTNPYTLLRQVKTNSIVHLVGNEKREEETLLKYLGCGGSKQAFQISSHRALLMPNINDSIDEITSRWERMVLEEVKMSQMINKLGLLSPNLKQVTLYFKEFSNFKIPAYVCDTFESFKLQNCFIIDTKNENSSTWKNRENFLFSSDNERFDIQNWDSVFDSLINDIAIICRNNIPTQSDSINLAVIKKPSDLSVCQYEIRYFGFDFSHKLIPLNLPPIENEKLTTINADKINRILDHSLNQIFVREFGFRFLVGDESQKINLLKQQLMQKFIPLVFQKINSENHG